MRQVHNWMIHTEFINTISWNRTSFFNLKRIKGLYKVVSILVKVNALNITEQCIIKSSLSKSDTNLIYI